MTTLASPPPGGSTRRARDHDGASVTVRSRFTAIVSAPAATRVYRQGGAVPAAAALDGDKILPKRVA